MNDRGMVIMCLIDGTHQDDRLMNVGVYYRFGVEKSANLSVYVESPRSPYEVRENTDLEALGTCNVSMTLTMKERPIIIDREERSHIGDGLVVHLRSADCNLNITATLSEHYVVSILNNTSN
jgi:hypothetical protein